jgi:hypothetical protein
MTASTLSPAGPLSAWEAPVPVLLNAWKHHAAFLRRQVREASTAGDAGLDALAANLVVVGTELMDLYTGRFTPAEIAAKVLDELKAKDLLAPPAYRAWVAESGGYAVTTFAEDSSRWVLRVGDEDGRYVHVHPARWAPETRRVRANVMKTAALVLAHAGVHGGDPLDRARANAVRQKYLGLAPIGRELSGDQGLGALLDLLK